MVGFTQAFATYGASHPGTPGILLATWLQNWLWVPFIGLAFTFLPLLFPDGRLPSRRWRPVAWLSVFDIGLLVVAFGFTPSGAWGLIPNPVWVVPAGALADALQIAAGATTIVTGTMCASAPLVRYRRAGPEERAQLRWVAVAVTIFVAQLLSLIHI